VRPRQSTASAAIEMAAMPEKERWRTSGRRAAPVIRAYTSCEASRPREGRLESSVAACTWKETHTPNRTTSSEPSRRTTPPRPSARRTRSEYEPGASQSSSSQPVYPFHAPSRISAGADAAPPWIVAHGRAMTPAPMQPLTRLSTAAVNPIPLS